MRYYIVAGERSGDLHGSNLIKALKRKDNQANFRCWGGEYMEKAGAELVVHYRNLAFMGIMEVALYFNKILRFIRLCKKDILNYKPDVVILIDFGGFNLRVAKFLKKRDIKVYYYISPKVWAWNTGRAKTIKATIDHMFVILPFEKAFYKTFGYDVDYVGNPVVDAVRNHQPDPSFLEEAGIKKEDRYIALLPGSRNQELKGILPLMIKLAANFPNERFVVAAVSTVPEHLYWPCKKVNNIKIVFDRTNDILAFAFAGVITSGTATLETALWEVPQVVVYRTTSKISAFIARLVVKTKHISLVNLIIGREVVKELIQEDLNKETLSLELNTIIFDNIVRNRIFQDYKELKNILGDHPVSERAAELMTHYLKA